MPVNALWGMVACQLIQLGNAARFLPSDQLLMSRAALSIGHLIYVSVSRIDLSQLSIACLALSRRIVCSFIPRKGQPCLARSDRRPAAWKTPPPDTVHADLLRRSSVSVT